MQGQRNKKRDEPSTLLLQQMGQTVWEIADWCDGLPEVNHLKELDKSDMNESQRCLKRAPSLISLVKISAGLILPETC